jgi:hypothetical protein
MAEALYVSSEEYGKGQTFRNESNQSELYEWLN